MPELTAYPQLVKLINDEFQRGLFEARRHLERQRLITYWKVGEHLDHYFRQNQLTDEDRQHEIFCQIGHDLHHEPNFVKKLFLFYLTYPQMPDNGLLNWSHYRTLITISEESRRVFWERRIVNERLPSDTFYELFRAENSSPEIRPQDQGQSGILPVVRGRLYTYRAVSPNEIAWEKGSVVLDTGFEGRRQVATAVSASLIGGHKVVSYKDAGEYTVKRTDIANEQMYTYQAFLERVIDGDTIIANVDCGFGCWSHQRLRFFGINAPELSKPGGIEAKRFVQRPLESCAWFIVKTYLDRQEKYGRYLADVFFFPGGEGGVADGANDPQRAADDGVFLNQLLIDEGHAERYQG